MAAFGAGIHAGLASFPILGATISLGAIGWWASRTRWGLLPWGALAGVAIGRVAGDLDQHTCAHSLPAGTITITAVVGPSLAREQVVMLPVEAGCQGPITARWRFQERLEVGQVVSLTGRWIPVRPARGPADGVLAVERLTVTGHGRSGGRPPAEERIVELIGQLYGGRAPMVEALILGRRTDLDREVREAFARAGLIHLLAISGFHVGVISGWVFLLFRLAGTSRRLATTGAVLFAAGYAAWLGFPPPATRAAALVALLAMASARQRRVQPEPLLAACCLLMLLADPWAVRQLGAWLSAAAIWGVTRFSRWSDRNIGRAWGVRTAAASVGATLATAPLTAGVIGQVSIIGIGLNFLAIPVASLAIPGVFASLAISPIWAPGGEALAAGAGLALVGLERLAVAGASVPWGSRTAPPGVGAALPWITVLALALWVLGRRIPWQAAARRLFAVLVAAVWLTLIPGWRHDLGATEPGLTLYHLQVGQGDAAALRTPAGRWVVVDAGPTGRPVDAGRAVIAPFLLRHGVRRIEWLVLSHAHADHLGGAVSLLDRFQVGTVVEPGIPVSDTLYRSLLDRIVARGSAWRPGRAGDRWELDGVRFEILHPDTTWTGWREDLNEDSLVLLVEFGRFRAVLVGDAGGPVESLLADRIGDVDLLKVGHHGSRSATGSRWLAALAPELAVVSLGRNRYGHPAPEVLGRLGDHGASIWRTDQDGTVTVWTDGQQWRASARTRQETSQARGRGQWHQVHP